MERVEGPTPSGGAYAEAYYVDENNEEVAKEIATNMIIKEYDEDDNLINTVYGTLVEEEES